MASFGAKAPKFAPFNTSSSATTTYGTVITIGKLVRADMTVQLASGELYADDVLVESVDEFVSASIAMETDDLTDTVAAALYGATAGTSSDPTLTYNVDDTQGQGGLAYYKVLMRGGVKYYKGYFYPHVKAILGNDSAQTKGSSITFGTSNTTFKVFADENGDWRETAEFTTETACTTWVSGRFT